MAFPSVAQYFVVELLSIIFLECLPEEDLQVVRTLRDMRNEAPISVSQVCQHWRYVSFSTHRLWSTLSLSSIEYIRASSRCPSSALQSFLLRSGGTNFHFKITCVNKNLEPGGPILDYVPNHWSLVKPVLDEISGRERIKGLTLRIGISAADPAMEYVIEEFPALEHLSFQTFPIYSRPCQPYTILDRTLWGVASRLVSLELTGVHQFMLHLDSMVMCPNLKYLALNCFFILRELIRFMDCCPVLESLYINFDGPIPTLNEKKPARRTILRTIRTLEMRVEDPAAHVSMRDVFRFFQLPNLRRLVLHWRTSQESTLETFILESHPPLEELSLTTMDDGDFQEEPIIRILKLLPGLKKLRIRHQHAILKELTLSNSGNVALCPLLEAVTFEIKKRADSTDEPTQTLWKATEDMISSHWKMTKTGHSDSTSHSAAVRSGRTLRKMVFSYIYTKDWEAEQLYSGIRDIQREGLDVSFRDERRVSTMLWK